METIQICIGTEPKTSIPYKVLCYSIIKHLNPEYQVEFYPMMGKSWINRTTSEGTGFSLQRWYIPEYFLFSGKAIYLDVDMLCFTDITELWNIDLSFPESRRSSIYCTFQKDKFYERAPATSCMLIDCERAKDDWKLYTSEQINAFVDTGKDRTNYISLMHGFHAASINEIPLKWNRFNNFVSEDSSQRLNTGTSILHYTEEPKQPWYYPDHPWKDLWRDALIETIEAGIISNAEIKAEVQRFKPHTKVSRGQGLHPYWLKFAKD